MARARPPKVMKNTFCLATALNGNIALPFVIPSEAEGSAVLQACLGNVSGLEARRVGRQNVSPARQGWDLIPQHCPSAVGAAHFHLNLHQ